MWPFGGGEQSWAWAYGCRGLADLWLCSVLGGASQGAWGRAVTVTVGRTESRAEQSTVLFQTFDVLVPRASCVWTSCEEGRGRSAPRCPTRRCSGYSDLPSRSSLCPVPAPCLLWTPWEPAGLIFPRPYECRCAASPCPCSAGAWPACLSAAQLASTPAPCRFLVSPRLGSGKGVCRPMSSWARAAACSVRRALWYHPGASLMGPSRGCAHLLGSGLNPTQRLQGATLKRRLRHSLI